MNWGYKIFIAFLAFVLFMGVLIYRTFQAKVNLVAPDYYQQELVFQEQIEKIENERALEQSATISHDAVHQSLLVSFPQNLKVKVAQLSFYRPSDANLDLKVEMQLNSDNYQELSTSQLASGLWKVKLDWQDHDSKSYYKEQNVFLK